ncbi:MAG: DUF3795 domain-containing protein [Desulfobacteraceae bacterium]|jgi:hypothetical protein
MEINADYLAPCGLYCGVCGILYATRNDNQKFRDRLLGVYRGRIPGSENLRAEDIHCRGCLSEEPFIYCRMCSIKDCVSSRGYSGCHQCEDFPCAHIDAFPIPVGKKVIMRAIPYWREMGTERWVKDEEARYRCPECGHRLFRGAKRCNRCRTEVDLDG